jgi:hypothetical protein
MLVDVCVRTRQHHRAAYMYHGAVFLALRDNTKLGNTCHINAALTGWATWSASRHGTRDSHNGVRLVGTTRNGTQLAGGSTQREASSSRVSMSHNYTRFNDSTWPHRCRLVRPTRRISEDACACLLVRRAPPAPHHIVILGKPSRSLSHMPRSLCHRLHVHYVEYVCVQGDQGKLSILPETAYIT